MGPSGQEPTMTFHAVVVWSFCTNGCWQVWVSLCLIGGGDLGRSVTFPDDWYLGPGIHKYHTSQVVHSYHLRHSLPVHIHSQEISLLFMAHVFFLPLEFGKNPNIRWLSRLRFVGRTHVGFCGRSEATSRTSTTPWVARGAENSERVVEVGSKEWVKHEKNMPLFTGKHEEVGWWCLFIIVHQCLFRLGVVVF